MLCLKLCYGWGLKLPNEILFLLRWIFFTECSYISLQKVKSGHFEAAMEKERHCLDNFLCLGKCLFNLRLVQCVGIEVICLLQH